MGIYIGMKKLGENDETVSYIFDMLIVDQEHFKEEPAHIYKINSRRAYGYCTLNKNTEEVTLHEDKTDQYFLQHRSYFARVGAKLVKILRSGMNFPETTCYAS